MRAIGFADPADPRDGRRTVLADAGAMLVATGADELSMPSFPQARIRIWHGICRM